MLFTDEELKKIENERMLLRIIALRCCMKCKLVNQCFQRDYCRKIYRFYEYYLEKWKQIHKK